MLSAYETMTTTQKNQFKDTANKLLATTFLCRDKKDNKENYYFLYTVASGTSLSTSPT